MHTLNIYSRISKTSPQAQYLFSIQQTTRKDCLKIAEAKYSDLAWDWDDKNHVKRKKFNAVAGSTVSLNLSDII
jgi:hypothetical protein